MNAKTIMMALAATVGLAASASVIEVKFTVKTETTSNKLANKVISGLVNQETNEHVFWTKVGKENVPYTNTYFGVSNDKQVAKKDGRNAELIWGGDAEDPDNVLVAGAWGSKSGSMSGQVAGMINRVPATGTWSAKVSKKSYDELLKKYDLEQVANKKTSVIDDFNADIAAVKLEAKGEIAKAEAKAEADVKAAEGDAAAKIKAAEEKANRDIANAKEQGDEAVKAAKQKAAEELAKAKDDAQKELDEAKTKAAEELAKAKDDAQNELDKKIAEIQKENEAEKKAAKEAADQALAAEQKKLKEATEEFLAYTNTLVGALQSLDDSDMPNMISSYLNETVTKAMALRDAADARIRSAWVAFDAYTNSLNVVALSNNVITASEAFTATQKVYDVVSAKVAALQYTNDQFAVINSGELTNNYNTAWSDKTNEIATLIEAIVVAETNFEAQVNWWSNNVDSASKIVERRAGKVDVAKQALKDAEDEYITATNNLAWYDATNTVDMTYDQFIEANKPDSTNLWDALEAYTKYEIYKSDKCAEGRAQFSNDVAVAYTNYLVKGSQLANAVNSYDSATNDYAQAYLTWTNMTESGVAPSVTNLQAQLSVCSNELADIEADFDFWKNYQYSEQDFDDVKSALADATDEKAAVESNLNWARDKRLEAELAYEGALGSQTELLAALASEIGLSVADLRDAEGHDLPVAEIKAMVEDYLNKPLSGLEDGKGLQEIYESADKIVDACAKIAVALGCSVD